MKLKKLYIKPSATIIHIDNSITLMMISNPGPRGGGNSSPSKGNDQPFQSPFGEKPLG
jgi:hypothetical protein